MNVVIVDDQDIAAEILIQNLEKCVEEEGLDEIEVTRFYSGEEFINEYHKGMCDVIFMDIFMDEMSGVEAARRLREIDMDVTVVFCTSYNEYAAESYEIGAVYYLLKPYNYAQVVAMMKRVVLTIEKPIKYMELPDGTKIIPRDIISTEYYNHKITIHMHKSEDVSVRISQVELEEMLKSEQYIVSVNRGYMVNMHMIEEIDCGEARMIDGSIIPISRGRKNEVKSCYESFRRRIAKEEIVHVSDM